MLKIIAYPHPTLRHVSKPLRKVDAELKTLVRNMFDLMYEFKGIGLAANQVDLPFRLFIMNLAGKAGDGEEMVFMNPVISQPKGNEEAEEGCLSLPGLYGQVKRPKSVRLQAYNEKGQEVNLELTGLPARCVQHEVDHLDGVLFIDRMDPLQRQAFLDQLDEFEGAFQSQRNTQEISADDVIKKRLAEWESRYC